MSKKSVQVKLRISIGDLIRTDLTRTVYQVAILLYDILNIQKLLFKFKENYMCFADLEKVMDISQMVLEFKMPSSNVVGFSHITYFLAFKYFFTFCERCLLMNGYNTQM